MSKEMFVIVLGILVVLTRTMLGIPGSWQTVLLVFAGLAIAVIGFLLRGEAISRAAAARPAPATERKNSYSFVESPATDPTSTHEHHETVAS